MQYSLVPTAACPTASDARGKLFLLFARLIAHYVMFASTAIATVNASISRRRETCRLLFLAVQAICRIRFVVEGLMGVGFTYLCCAPQKKKREEDWGA